MLYNLLGGQCIWRPWFAIALQIIGGGPGRPGRPCRPASDAHEKHDVNLTTLPYKVKKQYVQISNLIDTSIKRPILGQSTFMIKGCMDITLDMVDITYSYWKTLIVC